MHNLKSTHTIRALEVNLISLNSLCHSLLIISVEASINTMDVVLEEEEHEVELKAEEAGIKIKTKTTTTRTWPSQTSTLTACQKESWKSPKRLKRKQMNPRKHCHQKKLKKLPYG
jgi:hypothetical protein